MSRFPRVGLALITLVLVASTSPAQAQTRFSVEAGPLVPFSDFADAVDASAWIGARAEYQPMNSLGQVAELAFVVQTGYADLELDTDLDASASLWALGAGVRVYSMALPFFLHGGIEYMSTDLDFGPIDASTDGFGPTFGAGLNFGLGGVFVEVEGRLHLGVGADDEEIDPRFTTLTAALGLPF
ncbi:MAG TPA: outer membrane beta-barrel protein [Candidatus Krumholzibacteria bacterium]|nr:outer membrane beta-barrel protein [Candidatus Krumholzibacteria bacterium]